MTCITIKSPDDIRREVNMVKQWQRSAKAKSKSKHGHPMKRFATYTDLSIDFGQSAAKEKTIQAQDLAILINCAPGGRLESLSLEHVRVQGDWASVLHSIRTSPAAQHLQSFSSYSCSIRYDPQELIQLGLALSALPKLASISMGLTQMKHQPAWKILTPVVAHCPCITKIFVNGFHGPCLDDKAANQEVVEFLQACERSTSLNRLLCLPMRGRAFGAPPVMQALAHVIKNNASLHTLEIYLAPGTDATDLARALQHNSTLHRLALFGRQTAYSEREEEAFYQCFKNHNYTLQELTVDPWSQDTSSPLNFELALNRMGRNELLNQRATTEEWIDAIANKDDISVIYYFLGKNPTLCDPKMWAAMDHDDESDQDEDDYDYHYNYDDDTDEGEFEFEGEYPTVQHPSPRGATVAAMVSPESRVTIRHLLSRMQESSYSRKRCRGDSDDKEEEDNSDDDSSSSDDDNDDHASSSAASSEEEESGSHSESGNDEEMQGLQAVEEPWWKDTDSEKSDSDNDEEMQGEEAVKESYRQESDSDTSSDNDDEMQGEEAAEETVEEAMEEAIQGQQPVEQAVEQQAAEQVVEKAMPLSGPSAVSTAMRVVTTTAYTAAVFAAGYFYRGMTGH